MKFLIEPYKKVGPLYFGMSRAETEQALESIDRSVDSDDGITELYNFTYDIVAQVRKISNQLIEVGFGHRAKEVYINNIRFFDQPQQDVLSELYNIDPNAFVGHGSIVFLNLGISLTGFASGDDSSRSMTAFAAGVWDDIIPSMKPYNP
jgi:hypothetical protein